MEVLTLAITGGGNDCVLNGGTADRELKTTVESTSRVNSQCKE